MTELKNRVKEKLGIPTKYDYISLIILVTAQSILISTKTVFGVSSEFVTLAITTSIVFVGIIIRANSEDVAEKKIKKLEKRIEELEKKK